MFALSSLVDTNELAKNYKNFHSKYSIDTKHCNFSSFKFYKKSKLTN